MNVLSVDFDYFQIVDMETLGCYPDGLDLGTEISKLIWAGHYANPRDAEKILKVCVDTDKLYHVERIIKDSYSIGTKVMICNSHKNIYDFILDTYNEREESGGVNIYNVDMHHDLINNNTNVDCGNWISHILKEIKGSTITWIANPISKEAYGMDRDKFSMVSEDVSDLDDIEFDMVFLCRSDIWTPPHLDSYFKELSYNIIDTYEDVLVERGVLEERDCTKEILEMGSIMKKMQSKGVAKGEK